MRRCRSPTRSPRRSRSHEQGIIHRDLKPANIKVRADGTVKVLDFGLAKAIDGPGGSGRSGEFASMSPTLTTPAMMTGVGMILGTAAYMSPEQAKGRAVDRRSDIWAFGAVLFEMLTGTRAFGGDDVQDTFVAIMRDEPDWARLPAALPFALGTYLKRCLRKDAKQRVQAMGDVRLALEGAFEATAPQIAAPPAAAAPSSVVVRALPWTVAGIFGVALIAALVLWAPWRADLAVDPQMVQYTVAQPDKGTAAESLAISPDGHYIVMQTSGSGQQLWVRSLDSLQTQPLSGTEGALFPFWSPDSRYIGFFAQNQLKKIAVTGGPAQALCDAPTGRGGAWSRDGVIVFAPNNGDSGFSRVSAAGGVPVPLTTKRDGGGNVRWPVFLPDGRRFLYLGFRGKVNGIFVASLDTGDGRRLVLDESNPQYVPPSSRNPFGHLLFVRQQTLMAQPVDPQTLDPKGDLFPVAERVALGASNGQYLHSASRNGILVLYSGGGTGSSNQLAWFDRTGKEVGTVGAPARSRNAIALSPDGKRVVVERNLEGPSSDLWITDMEHSGTETRLTFDASINRDPVWSPDGRRVAFASTRKGHADLYLKASNGTGEDELLFESKDAKGPTDWSRDGRFLIFVNTDAKTSEDLWALPVTGDKKPIPLLRTQYREGQAQLSPDSRWLAYASNESGQYQVYVQPFAPGRDTPMTGKWQISTTGGEQPRWRGDGKELFYLDRDRKVMAVDVRATAQSFDRGAPRGLFDSRINNFSRAYAPSPDGARFLMPVPQGARGEAPPLTVVVNWLSGVKK